MTGLTATLEAVVAGRIRQLVYSDRFAVQGGECKECGALFDGAQNQCPSCSGAIDEVDDLLESLVVKVVGEGGDLEQVRGIAAEQLVQGAGGIGASLRF